MQLSPTNVAATDNCSTPIITCSSWIKPTLMGRAVTYKATRRLQQHHVCVQTINWTIDY